MRQIGIPFKVVNTCDCDKDACLSYAAMRHNIKEEMKTFNFPSKEQMVIELQEKNLGFDFEHKQKHTITMRTNEEKIKQYYIADKLSKNLGDISKVEKLPYADLVTYSFPCTDLSVAGKGEGMVNKCECGYSWPIDFSNADESLICPKCGKTVARSTRSGLLGQVQRLLTVASTEGTLPKYLLLENVKNLVGKKFKPQFDDWVKWFDSIGYNTYYKVINAKRMGIPQNRERIFAVSIRKDVDNQTFKFPEPIPLAHRLKDVLETNVPEKYYLPDDRVLKIIDKLNELYPEPICVASRGRNPKNPSDRTIGAPTEQRLEPNMTGCTNTITSVAKDNWVAEPQVQQIGNCMPGTNRANPNQGRVYDSNGISPALTTMEGGNRQPMIVEDFYQSRKPRIYADEAPTLRSERIGLKVAEEKSKVRWRIRKLTERECWRLMGFTDEDVERAAQYVSASALYHQAGNSIVTACLIGIFSSLLIRNGYLSEMWSKNLIDYKTTQNS